MPRSHAHNTSPDGDMQAELQFPLLTWQCDVMTINWDPVDLVLREQERVINASCRTPSAAADASSPAVWKEQMEPRGELGGNSYFLDKMKFSSHAVQEEETERKPFLDPGEEARPNRKLGV